MDINGSEFLIIALLALILIGPERLPEYVRGLRSVVLRLRALLRDGQVALKDELGTDVDWSQLDPRHYDPRRIVRDALFDDDNATATTGNSHSASVATAAMVARKGRRADILAANGTGGIAAEEPVFGLAPFDPEAT